MIRRLKRMVKLAIMAGRSYQGLFVAIKNPKWNIESTVIVTGEWRKVRLSGRGIISHGTYIVVSGERGGGQCALIVGDRSYIGEYNNIRAAGGVIEIGEGVLISQFVSIIGANHKIDAGAFVSEMPWDTSKVGVKIGDGAWIGANSVILPGVEIGAGAIVGAGSVVTKSIPANAIAVGSPARVVRYR